MTPLELKTRLKGVLAFPPTPFTADDRLDGDGLAKQIDFLCRSGAHVVVVCGGTGEFFSLDMQEYRTSIRVAVEAAADRVPVIAGIGHGTRVACELASYAESVGADGLMIHPFYFVEPSLDGLVGHYQALARATGLGLITFSTKALVVRPPLMQRLAEIESIIALKDEYGDVKVFVETMLCLGDRLAWINGMAEVVAGPYFAAGAQGFSSGIVNFAPEISLAVWRAGSAGRWTELNDLVARRVRPLASLRERRQGNSIPVVKEAMNMLGLPGGVVRSPLMPLNADDREELRRVLIEFDLLRP